MWDNQIYGMSPLGKKISLYQKDYSNNELKTNIISHICSQVIRNIISSIQSNHHSILRHYLGKKSEMLPCSMRDPKLQEYIDQNRELFASILEKPNLQLYIDENRELLAWAMDDLNRKDVFTKARCLVPHIIFPKGYIERRI